MKKLYRSRDDKMLAGVCGGLAEYFGIDSTIVRLITFLLIFPGGLSVWVYIAMAIVIPLRPKNNSIEQRDTDAKEIDNSDREDFYNIYDKTKKEEENEDDFY